MLLMLWTMLMSPFAHAEQGPYMWGVGPTLNTIVFPTHPIDFPDDVESVGGIERAPSRKHHFQKEQAGHLEGT